jgi:hypothetical protein
MDVIDMHDHFIAPEIIDFLTREGKHFATRIVERDGRRFFLIQEKAMRPIEGPISNAQAREYLSKHERGVASRPRWDQSVHLSFAPCCSDDRRDMRMSTAPGGRGDDGPKPGQKLARRAVEPRRRVEI